MAALQVSYIPVSKDELPAAIEIEKAGFIPEEAASLSTFEYRQAQAPDLFLGAYIEQSPPLAQTENSLSTRKLIGYIAATVASTDALTSASMKEHVPISEGGVSVCIHSVCVHPQWRKKGVAHGLLREYHRRLNTDGDKRLRRALLICHDYYIDFYRSAGFELVGKSAVVHGPEVFYEMNLELSREESANGETKPSAASASELPPEISPDVLAALSNPSSTPGARIRRFIDFPSTQDLVTNDPSSGAQSNKFKIICPREGCGSVILLAGVGKLVEGASIQLDSPNDPPPPAILPPLAPAPDTIKWWLITPNLMQFENIGFSRGLPLRGSLDIQMKLLSCAECDLGPLGWSQEGGSEFWLACSRVSYRD